jgi:hypothetical protein
MNVLIGESGFLRSSRGCHVRYDWRAGYLEVWLSQKRECIMITIPASRSPKILSRRSVTAMISW